MELYGKLRISSKTSFIFSPSPSQLKNLQLNLKTHVKGYAMQVESQTHCAFSLFGDKSITCSPASVYLRRSTIRSSVLLHLKVSTSP